jgi:high-affinity iron transporter
VYCRLVLALVAALAAAPIARAEVPDARRIVHLLQYVAKDYPGALDSKSADELAEQIGFLKEARVQLREMPAAPERQALDTSIAGILAIVEKHGPADEVTQKLTVVVKDIGAVYRIKWTVPTSVSWSHGKDMYVRACASCHGPDGNATVPVAAEMEPKPAKFTNPEVMAKLTPVRAFDTISFGITGTPMPSFGDALSEKDRWDLAFYVFTLRPDHEDPKALPSRIAPLTELAHMSDERLEDVLKGQGVPVAQVAGARAAVRATSTYQAVTPGGIERAREFLAKARALAAAGDATAATHQALDAYLNGFENVEPFLKVVDIDLMKQIELAMLKLPRDLRSGIALEEVNTQVAAITKLLDDAEQVLARKQSDASWFPFSASFLIMVREGVESILVLAMLVAVLGKIGCRDQVQLVWRGAVAALVAGFAIWAGTQYLFFELAAAEREAFEGVTTLVAAALLYWAGLWMLSRLETQRWLALIKTQLAGSISVGSRGGVMALSFLAVFREVVETILFYQALLAQYPAAGARILQGALAGVLVIAVIGYLILVLGVKLPLSRFFGVSSIGMLLLAVYMVGQGFVALGAAGWLMPGSWSFIDQLGGPAGVGRALQIAMVLGFALALVPLLKPSAPKSDA